MHEPSTGKGQAENPILKVGKFCDIPFLPVMARSRGWGVGLEFSLGAGARSSD